AGTILLLLIFTNSSSYSIGYSYAAKKNASVRNENIPPPETPILPTPPIQNENIPQPLPIPSPGLLGTLIVTGKVSSGDKTPSDFTISVSGNNPKPASFSGSSAGTPVTLQAGKYNVSSSTADGYTTTYSSGCSGSISEGRTIKCTVTNKYTGPPP